MEMEAAPPYAQRPVIQHKNRKGCSAPDLASGAHDRYEVSFDRRGSYSKCHQHPNLMFDDYSD